MADRLWVAFDCETTGLLPNARLIEIAAIAFRSDGIVIQQFQQLVRAPVAVPEFVTELTGITDEMICNAEPSRAVLQRFCDWLPQGSTLVGHNISFDLAILAIEDATLLPRLQCQCVDSLDVARHMGEFPDNRLETVAGILAMSGHGLHADDRSRHRALADAYDIRDLVVHALSRLFHRKHPDLFAGRPAMTYLPGRFVP